MESQIGQIAKRFGVSVNTIRHYEERGLIGPLKRRAAGYASKGYRIFSPQDISRLEFVRQARMLELSLEQIKELLDSIDQGCCSAARPELKGLLGAKLQETEEKMAGLRRFRHQLKRWLHRVTEMLAEGSTASCTPASTPSRCAFGTARGLTTKKEVKRVGTG